MLGIRQLFFASMLCFIACFFPTITRAQTSTNRLAEVAVTIKRPIGAPRLSDICFSSRWPRPLNSNDPHNTFEAAKAFHATRIDWSYSNDVAFIQDVKKAGLVYFGTISSEMDGIKTDVGREKNYLGRLIGNPELSFLMARGDINSPEYQKIVMDHLRILIDGGADGIQVDDPGMTYHNMQHLGGGYGDASLAKFRAYLEKHSTSTQRKSWGMPMELDGFDYAAYVREREGKVVEPVQALFVAFHRESLDQFYKTIRHTIDEHAGRHVPFSCNNWSSQQQDAFPFKQHFDFWVGETSVQYGLPTAKRIYEKTKTAEALGKVQVFSPPNDGFDKLPTRASYVDLTRKLIATSYASGSATLVPWDVWRRGDGTPRFFGTTEEFGDLFDLIAKQRSFYANHEEAFATGAGIQSRRAPELPQDPAKLVGAGDDILLTLRAVPRDTTAPVVLHAVDWSQDPKPFSIALRHDLFGQSANAAMKLHLYQPGAAVKLLTPEKNDDAWTYFAVLPLRPYGLLVFIPDEQ